MSQNKKIIIVEDEAIIGLDIKMRLEAMNFLVCAIVSKPHLVIPSMEEHEPDCVLMDINLKGNNEGIDLAEEIMHANGTPVVFLTAFTDKITFNKANETYPFGYLTKPVKDADLRNAIEMALQQYKNLTIAKDQVAGLQKRVFDLSLKNQPTSNSIFVKDGSGYLNIKFGDILWVKADDVYSNVVTDKSEMLVNILLGDLLIRLPNTQFIRIHRSYIVSLDKIDKVTSEFVIIKGKEVPISKSYKKELFDRIS